MLTHLPKEEGDAGAGPKLAHDEVQAERSKNPEWESVTNLELRT